MIGFSLPIEWPTEPQHRAQLEADVLGFLEQRLKSSPQFDALVERMVPGGNQALVESVVSHWHDPTSRPDVVTRFLERYGV